MYLAYMYFVATAILPLSEEIRSHSKQSHVKSHEILHWDVSYDKLPEEFQISILDPSRCLEFWEYLLLNQKIKGVCLRKALKKASTVFIYVKLPIWRRHESTIRIQVDFPLEHPVFYWKEFNHTEDYFPKKS